MSPPASARLVSVFLVALGSLAAFGGRQSIPTQGELTSFELPVARVRELGGKGGRRIELLLERPVSRVRLTFRPYEQLLRLSPGEHVSVLATHDSLGRALWEGWVLRSESGVVVTYEQTTADARWQARRFAAIGYWLFAGAAIALFYSFLIGKRQTVDKEAA